jgi:GAF domain-containing protein/PAS domain-containing protein/anti-sigma regulatory factor (Ser/Thr protein kinase)
MPGKPASERVRSPARSPFQEQLPWRRRFRRLLNLRSVASQVFALQAIIVLLLVAAAVGEVILQSRNETTAEARNRSLAVAQTFANSPGIATALHSPNPTAILQPQAEAARKLAHVDFIVVTNTQGIRYTHPLRNRIGKKFIGTLGQPLAGQPVTETVHGTIGPLVQADVPVFDAHHKVIGMVSAGITISEIRGTVDQQLPVLFICAAAALALATVGTALVSSRLRRQTHGLDPAEMTRMYEHHDAVLHAVREGVMIVGGDGRLLLANDEAIRLLDLPANAQGRLVTDLGLEEHAAALLASGHVVTDEVLSIGDRLLAVNNRPTDRNGGPPGSVTTLRDATELRVLSSKADEARRRLKLLYDASGSIGTTLDVTRTAEELVQVAVPRFADFITVDLAEPILRGEEPSAGSDDEMRRIAVGGIREDHPFSEAGQRLSFIPGTPQAAGLRAGRGVLAPRLEDAPGWRAQDPAHAQRIINYGVHSLITVPLCARGTVLGLVNFWRSQQPEPFEEDDFSLAEELVGRAAVCIDNARRYTREHAMAVTLQRSLLPRGLPEQSALEVAYRYLPAQAGVSGDWFDVIPLPGARVALVVGDVVGHGLHAAATMGRLRTAVHNFSTLDLPPDELLGHLDELIGRIDSDEAAGNGELPVAGATCLYAIYDPVARRCVLSRAGHPPPALVHPDGRVEFPELPAGLPLGLGGMPFEATEWQVPEGSQLVLYTDGLIENRDRDIDVGFELLSDALSRGARNPEQTCMAVLDTMLPDRQNDDIALLVARTRTVQPDQIADWDVPSDPAAVGGVRAEVLRKLAQWDLDEVGFTTELILSELITNAIRYTHGPIQVRLLRDRTLICEVSDSSSTSPHLRYAASTDEGGRGLFLVAQLADRWGTRYTEVGKVIWTEQALPSIS